MQLVLPRMRGFTLPPGLPRVNWDHPLSAALVAAVVPGTSQYDLVTGLFINGASSAKTFPALTGQSAVCTAASQGYNSLIKVPPSMQITGNVSLFWHGVLTANNTNNTPLIGIEANSTGASPFASVYIMRVNTFPAKLGFAYNTSVTNFGEMDNASLISTTYNVPQNLLVTATSGGSVNGYQNGILTGSFTTVNGLTYNGAQTYGSGAPLVFGREVSDSTRIIGGYGTAGYIWNRIITPAEAIQLATDPFCFLIFPEDDIFATLVGASALSSAARTRLSLDGYMAKRAGPFSGKIPTPPPSSGGNLRWLFQQRVI